MNRYLLNIIRTLAHECIKVFNEMNLYTGQAHDNNMALSRHHCQSPQRQTSLCFTFHTPY